MIRFDCFCKDIGESHKCTICKGIGYVDFSEEELTKDIKEALKNANNEQKKHFLAERFKYIDDA